MTSGRPNASGAGNASAAGCCVRRDNGIVNATGGPFPGRLKPPEEGGVALGSGEIFASWPGYFSGSDAMTQRHAVLFAAAFAASSFTSFATAGTIVGLVDGKSLVM